MEFTKQASPVHSTPSEKEKNLPVGRGFPGNRARKSLDKMERIAANTQEEPTRRQTSRCGDLLVSSLTNRDGFAPYFSHAPLLDRFFSFFLIIRSEEVHSHSSEPLII
ncbi:hypothetical protein H4Q26_010285 [Puccinia striiformis f. sp. tritici PST-130]|nr:hypothetical protein H4Q26_010285 [Puccinia striiformis f. sp. tritici PST-130]